MPRDIVAPMRRLVAVVIAVLLVQRPAAAQEQSAGDLFERGLAEMLAGRYAAGCPLIEQSYRLDPLPGAKFTLAECLAGWGKLANALAHYREYLAEVGKLDEEARAKQKDRLPVALAKVSELAERVPRLTVVLPPSAPTGTAVELDGVPLEDPGAEREVDPGEHHVVVVLPSGKTVRDSFVLAERERRQVPIELPQEEEGDGEPKPPPATGPHPLAIAGLTIGSVGIAGIVAGSIMGGLALGEKGTIDDNCVDHVCNADGKDAADRGQSFALASTVLLPVGAALLATGIVLYVLAPDGNATETETETGFVPRLAVDPTGFVAGGAIRW
jgi:hypothetical protein